MHTAPCGPLQSTVGTGGVDRERPKPEVADGDREGRLEKEQIGPPGRRTHTRTPTGTDPTYGKTALNSRPSAFVTFVKVAPKQLASLVRIWTVAWVLFCSAAATPVGNAVCPLLALF